MPPSATSVLRRLAACVVLAAALAVPGAARAAVVPLAAGFESGDLSQVSQAGVLDGSLDVTGARSYDGRRAASATYSGDGANGYARAIENVAWSSTEDVWYGGAYYLPTGYRASVKGGNDILRWDNWGTYGSAADYGAIENWSDGKTRLILGRYTDDPGIVLGGPFQLPEGRWFWLEVHQAFSTVSGQARSDVYLDGRLISHSTAANSFGRGADRVRWGLVCVDAGRQTTPLALTFDRVTISATEIGPLGSAPAPPTSASTGHHRHHHSGAARVARVTHRVHKRRA